MLIEFSVENFMSIKDKITLSMLAGNNEEKENNVIEYNKNRYLKSASIYGANASGKSNIFKAMTAAIVIIRKSSSRQINDKLLEIIPFKFDEESIKKPTKFQFIFSTNKTKYVYGFSADCNKIHEEYLYQYLSAKPSMIFERKNTNEYKFTQTEERELSEIQKKNTDNKLLLATATTWNYGKTKDAYMWFANEIDTCDDYESLPNYALEKFDNNDENLKKFTINLLKEAEINISNFNIQKENITNENIRAFFDDIVVQKILQSGGNIDGASRKIFTKHLIKNLNGEVNEYLLNLKEESLGTQNLFFLSPVLEEAFELGKTIVIDEIDKSLHPLLVRYIIELFHNPDINKNNAQLIFNTHDINLLSLDIFRRDQIYFVEKDYNQGTTELYSLDEFSVRKNENIQKGYLQGRYGAIPIIGVGIDLWK